MNTFLLLIHNLTQSLSFRAIVISILALALMIPMFMVNDTVHERGNRYKGVLNDIALTWGQQQTVIGPVLAVPYVEHIISVETVTGKDGNTSTISKDIFNDHTMIMLPEELNLDAEMEEEYRKRGIYNSLVYTAELSLKGHFNLKPLTEACNRNCSIKWDKAWLSVGLSDTRAINETSRFTWDDNTIGIEPGTRLESFLRTGFMFHLKIRSLKPPCPTSVYACL